MNVPQYVTVAEVRRICKELGLRDWTKLRKAGVLPREARAILNKVNTAKMTIALEDFRSGLDVELEHGIRFKDANVTNNHPILTGLIVLAHFKESLDYYRLLDVAELEGDLVKAIAEENSQKIKKYYRRLAVARIALSHAELKRVGPK
jgi:hypothetical protein